MKRIIALLTTTLLPLAASAASESRMRPKPPTARQCAQKIAEYEEELASEELPEAALRPMAAKPRGELSDEEVNAILTRLSEEVDAEVRAGTRASTYVAASPLSAVEAKPSRLARLKQNAEMAILMSGVLIANPLGLAALSVIQDYLDPMAPPATAPLHSNENDAEKPRAEDL